MSADPILVLQMHRMGDLILSFPLLGWLARSHPGHPVWTVAEPTFFKDLQPLSPNTTFFPPDAQERLQGVHFHSVINLSHRSDAARMAGSLRTEHRFGAHTRGEATYIDGAWSLYRAAIVHNNRHNLFHWGDLHLLDHVSEDPIPYQTPCLGSGAAKDRVGLFVGASEAEKRPDPLFFGELAKALLRKGFKPIFLGGPDDTTLGQAAATAAGIPSSNLCGRFTLAALAQVMQELALCITPDTGPMHLAAWLGTPVLNLSMGTVHACETGPAPPGHYVLRPRYSCSGCWLCRHTRTRCHDAFHPGRVAMVAQALISAPANLPALRLSGLELCRTQRDARGLYVLQNCQEPRQANARSALNHFWQEWFLSRMGRAAAPGTALQRLYVGFPALAVRLLPATLALGKMLSRHAARRAPLPDAFWHAQCPAMRLMAGHLHLRLQNAEYTPAAWETALRDVETLSLLLQKHAS